MVQISWILILIQWKMTTLLHRKSSKQFSWKESFSNFPLKHDFLKKGLVFSKDAKGSQMENLPHSPRTWSQSFLSSAAMTSLRMSSRQAAACPNFTKAGPKAWNSGSETCFMGKLNCYKILQVHKGTMKMWLLHTYFPRSSKKVWNTLRRCLITNDICCLSCANRQPTSL